MLSIMPLLQDVGVELQIHEHSIYQHHPFARNVVKFQHFLQKQLIVEVDCLQLRDLLDSAIQIDLFGI